MDALRARTLWDTQDGHGAAISIITYASFKLCAFVLEIIWKCALATQPGLCDAPEEKHGIIERALVLRVIPLFSKGYRTTLEAKDLYKIAPSPLNGPYCPPPPRHYFNLICAQVLMFGTQGTQRKPTRPGGSC